MFLHRNVIIFRTAIFNDMLHARTFSQSVWKSVVGLEIHAQIASESKLFSGAGTEFQAPVNTNVSMFDAAIPGTLPVLNRRCVEAAVMTALALSCQVNPVSYFDRKHYFYADLPAGYQITQQRVPLAVSGELKFHAITTGGKQQKLEIKKTRIKQIQLEQDSGKSLHDEEACRSLVDLNRAGIPLMELVFEPDLENGEEAAAVVKELILILQRLRTCSCKMEEGALRVDANVSVHRKNEPLGIRTELKNINSIRAVAHAVQYEIHRQINILDSGGTVVNETRAWDAESKLTVSMRDKEEKQDYRYMPEPNLPPLHVQTAKESTVKDNPYIVNACNIMLPELPEETRTKLKKIYGLSLESTIILVNENKLLEHFFMIMNRKQERDPKLTSNLLTNELLKTIHENKMNLGESNFSSEALGEIIDLLQDDKINLNIAKKLLQEMATENTLTPKQIVHKEQWLQITEDSEIERICKEIIEKNPKIVKQYLEGKPKVFNALVGQVAKATERKANMAKAVEILKNELNKIQR